MTRAIKIGSLAILAFFAAFTGTAIAAQAMVPAAPGEPGLLDLLAPVWEAFAAHRYPYAAALAIIALTAVAKRWGGPRFPWLQSNVGGSLLVLVMSIATAVAAGLASPDAKFTLDLLRSAATAGIAAAGAYALIKNLIIDPLLRPLAARAPSWTQPIFAAVFWIFDKYAPTGPDPIVEAEKAGSEAVKAAPATGTAGIVGKPTEIA